MEVSIILVDQTASPLVCLGAASVGDRVDFVVGSGRHIEYVPEAIESKSRGADHGRRRVAGKTITRSNPSHALDSDFAAMRSLQVDAGHGTIEDVGDEHLGTISQVIDR